MPGIRSTALLSLAVAAVAGTTLGTASPAHRPLPADRAVYARRAEVSARPGSALLGRSGALRAVILDPNEELALPLLWSGPAPDALRYLWTPAFGTREEVRLLGTPAGAEPMGGGRVRAPQGRGVWRLGLRAEGWTQDVDGLAVITRVPFSEKRDEYLNGYHIGRYPTEGEERADAYAPPRGFVEVTPENQDVQVSEHFRLRNFLTKDQFDVWPKYVALDLRLIDKLELVLQELRAMGARADAMAVMSGYRTPQYNGPGEGGRALLSRHTYGDASDVWVDSDSDGYMDDLNGDGQRDTGDARLLMRAVDRVEERFPELIGGAGAYQANSAHGPFVHIDVRGSRSRW